MHHRGMDKPFASRQQPRVINVQTFIVAHDALPQANVTCKDHGACERECYSLFQRYGQRSIKLGKENKYSGPGPDRICELGVSNAGSLHEAGFS
jgi:succinylarginine dihydrolase